VVSVQRVLLALSLSSDKIAGQSQL